MQKITLIALMASLVIPGYAFAQDLSVSEQTVTLLTKLTRSHLHEAVIDDEGNLVPPETATEKAQPILPFSEEQIIVRHGIIAALREYCGLPWREGFSTFMHTERQKGFTPKQTAYIGLLHGMSQGFHEAGFKEHGECPADMKANVQKLPE